MDKEKLREKIYSMSNSYLPLDMFFNDIEHIRVANYNKELAFSDLEKIADFVIDLQSKLAEKYKQIKELTECNQYLQIYRNKEKISFAIEKLQKVKEEAKHYGYDFSKSMHVFIDNQIKELKKDGK